MTSKIVVNNIEADAGVSTVTFGSNIQGNLIGNVTGNINSTGVTTVTTLNIGTGTSISSPASNTLTLGTNNVERVRVDSSGNVGIGTNNPGAKLEVFGDPTCTVYIRGGGPGSDTARRATLGLYASGNKIYNLRADASDGSFQILDSSTERLRISSSGNTGIGTNNPSAILDVESNDASAYIAEFRQKNANNSAQLIIDSPTNGTSRPVLIDLARAGTVQWSIGQGYLASSDRLIFATSSLKDGTAGEQIAISTTGNLLLKSGAGIDFSANANAVGTTSELFNDYEVGTFTPTLIGHTTAGTVATGTVSGTYTKIGNTVIYHVLWTNITYSVKPAGVVKISGLAFATLNGQVTGYVSQEGIDVGFTKAYGTNGGDIVLREYGTNVEVAFRVATSTGWDNYMEGGSTTFGVTGGTSWYGRATIIQTAST